MECRYEASRLRLAENGRRRQHRFPRSNSAIIVRSEAPCNTSVNESGFIRL